MVSKYLFYFFILAIAVITCYGNVTYQLDQDGIPFEPRDGKNCTRAGFMCDDCSTSSNCFQLPNGTWIKELVENCTASYTTCLESIGICTAMPNDDCPNLPVKDFVCTQPGIFPDPFDCAKYHICTPNQDKFEDHPMQCAPDMLYDPLTTLCSRKASSSCILPIPRCTNRTEGPVLGNPTLYYQCVSIDLNDQVFVPRLYQCPPDHKYMRFGCHDVKKPEKVVSNVCQSTRWQYKPGCTTHYACSSVGSFALRSSCGKGYYFNPNIEKCYEFGCDSLLL